MALKDLILRGPRPPVKKHRARKKSAFKPRLDPQIIDADTWFYEATRGLLIVHEIHTELGEYVRADQFVIPWKLVLASSARRGLVLGGKS